MFVTDIIQFNKGTLALINLNFIKMQALFLACFFPLGPEVAEVSSFLPGFIVVTALGFHGWVLFL